MKNLTKEVLIKLVLLQVLPWMQLSVVGKPLYGCSQTSEIELYDPTDPGAEIKCRTCPECPEGQGLSPQCGSKVTEDFKIECIQCQANKSYSNRHGIESCKACQECGLKNVIRHCAPDKNRICGTKCPQGYFLDHNHICQECYFCCDSVSEAQRRQECKDIGMSRKEQCEKTEQNQRCKEAFENVTTKPIDTELTVSPHHNTMTEKHVKTQVHDKFATTDVPHQPGKNLTRSEILSVDGSTPMTIQGTTKLAMLPGNDDPTNTAKSTKKQKEREELGAASLRVVIGVASIIFVISALALMTSKRINQFCWFSRTKLAKPADNTELIPLNSICEPTDSGRASPQDILTNEAPPLSCWDIELTTEESGKEVGKPNPADIPADCLISEMEKLHDDKGNLMLFYIQNKLDALRTPTRKTWRSIGQVLQVNSDDLDLIETDYIAGRSPTESLLAKLKNDKREPTMREFVEALITCDRHDVADFIYKWPWGNLFVPVGSENPCDVVQ